MGGHHVVGAALELFCELEIGLTHLEKHFNVRGCLRARVNGHNLHRKWMEVTQMTKVNEKDSGPSCSLAEALSKQDLFVNSTLAQLGCNLLWKLFREGMISHSGLYLNLKTMNVNPISL